MAKLNADIAAFATLPDLSDEIEMGKLLQGSTIPEPTISTISFLSGHKVETGAAMEEIRLVFDGIGHAWLATFQEAKSPADGGPATAVDLVLYNRARTARSVIRGCICHGAYEKIADAEMGIMSTVILLNAAGDSVETFATSEFVPPAV
jgi:hypothetical protein